MAKKRRLLSVVAPFYNEDVGVVSFYEGISPIFDQVTSFDFEIVCVDDGSQDNTLSELLSLLDRDSRIRIVELSRNFGKEAALTAGIDVAKGDAVILIDADLQDPPELIPRLIIEWQQGAEVVLARRTNRSADFFPKRITAQIFYWAHNIFSTIRIPKNVGDFRLMDRASIDALKQFPERQRFMKGLFAWVGFKTVTVDYTRNRRVAGTSKFSGWKLWNFALEGFTSFSTVPLRVWSYIGGVGALIALCYAAFIILKTIVYGVDVPGYASLLVAILFFGSLQLISIGMLGEYLGRIYMETKQRPIYLIRNQYERNDES